MVGQTQDGDFCPPCQARKARGLSSSLIKAT